MNYKYIHINKYESTINIAVYFAKHGRSWEKRTIEYCTKLWRQSFPKKTNPKRFIDVEFELQTILLNNWPRKKWDIFIPIKFLNNISIALVMINCLVFIYNNM